MTSRAKSFARGRRQPLAAAALHANSHVLGCGNSDTSSVTEEHNQAKPILGDYSVKIAGCEQYDYSGCDITTATCQQNTFALVKCVRQTQSGTMQPVQTLTASAYKAQLLNQDNPKNPDDLTRLGTALQLLGLASPSDLAVANQVDMIISNVAAFYSPVSKDVHIIVPDSGLTSNTQRADTLTLAHEFVHVLQDREHDLKAFSDTHDATFDSTLAAQSVVEGEARLYETLLRVAFDGLAQTAVNLPEYFQNAADYAFSLHTSDPPYLVTSLIFPYDYGGRYNYLELQSGGHQNIDALFTAPPTVALPYLLSQESIVTTDLSPVIDDAPVPAAGYSLFVDDSLGAWLTYESARPVQSNSTNQDAIRYAGEWRVDLQRWNPYEYCPHSESALEFRRCGIRLYFRIWLDLTHHECVTRRVIPNFHLEFRRGHRWG